MKISIITVAYNSADTIEDTLLSVADQTFRTIEHIIVDGGSSDGTLAIVDRHRAAIARILSEPDQGLYDAMNKGIGMATGDIVGLLNSDDVFADTQVLQRVADAFCADPEIDACYGDLCYVKRNDLEKVVRYWRSAPNRPGMFARGWVPPHPTLYVRRDLYSRCGAFDLSYRIAADFECMLRLFEVHRIHSVYLPHVMVKMRLGGTTNRTLKNIILQNLEIRRALRSHGIASSLAGFIMHKGISRLTQFIRRPA